MLDRFINDGWWIIVLFVGWIIDVLCGGSQARAKQKYGDQFKNHS